MIILALSLGLAACTTAPEATRGARMTDEQLEDAIRAKIATDAGLGDVKVDANAEGNTATLTGDVATQALRTKAVDLAKSARAGLVVTDKIDVKPRELTRADYTDDMARDQRNRAKAAGDNIGDSLDDAWIHTKIVARLITDPDTPQRKINVDVVNNAVTLRGTVDTAEAKTEAESIAKATEGVRSVRNQLVVKKS
jgi:hyperosmotically inducible protein